MEIYPIALRLTFHKDAPVTTVLYYWAPNSSLSDHHYPAVTERKVFAHLFQNNCCFCHKITAKATQSSFTELNLTYITYKMAPVPPQKHSFIKYALLMNCFVSAHFLRDALKHETSRVTSELFQRNLF